MHEATSPRFEFLTGFEGTHIFGSGRDVMDLTGHTSRFRDDLELMVASGIRSFRACIPWHHIEWHRGHYDWRWTDAYLGAARELGLSVIADPLHHTSFPTWLQRGFANPVFTDAYVDFVAAFATRYPWVNRFTVVNEPFVTTWFCGSCGIWHPRGRGGRSFVTMLNAVCRAIARVSEMLITRNPDVELIHVDACERHYALDDRSADRAAQGNALRFLVPDLLLGRVTAQHELYRYLRRHRLSAADIAWFAEHPTRIDVLGLDYYSHNELCWKNGKRVRATRAMGLVSVATDYIERYRMPVMLSETNLCATVSDRMSWLRFMVLECEQLQVALAARGQPFLGFCWYPFIDTMSWSRQVCDVCDTIDPQGLVSLHPSLLREPTELTTAYAALTRGEITGRDLPAYSFSREARRARGVNAFMHLMQDWQWQQAPTAGRIPRRRSAVVAGGH